jgi:glycosyltransferase involved in cell wall biosynthesis
VSGRGVRSGDGSCVDEGEPTKYFEYAAAGLPVVISDLPAKRRLVELNQNGTLVNPTDAHEVARRIAELLRDRESRARMACNGRRAFLERCNWEAVEPKLAALYDEISINST